MGDAIANNSSINNIVFFFLSELKIGLGWVGFYGISTIVGYLMPNPFLCK